MCQLNLHNYPLFQEKSSQPLVFSLHDFCSQSCFLGPQRLIEAEGHSDPSGKRAKEGRLADPYPQGSNQTQPLCLMQAGVAELRPSRRALRASHGASPAVTSTIPGCIASLPRGHVLLERSMLPLSSPLLTDHL